MRRLTIVAIAGLVLVGLGLVLALTEGPREVRSADGGVVTLESYAFQSSRVRHELPNRPVARVIRKVLPERTVKKVSWLRPETTIIVSASFPDEPFLSAVFTARDAAGKPQDAGTRLVVLDDRGQAFDGVINYMSANGVFSPEAFPRRGRELTLRLMDGERSMAEFQIPNPCPGPHSLWKPQRLPVVVTNGALEVSLVTFGADVGQQRTRCTFQVRDGGKESTAYQPASFEIFDATGNHWQPRLDGPVQVTNGLVSRSLFGALWPEEKAWRLRVEFKPFDKDAKDQSARTVEFLARPEQVRGARRQ